jgi:hypothetical protein
MSDISNPILESEESSLPPIPGDVPRRNNPSVGLVLPEIGQVKFYLYELYVNQGLPVAARFFSTSCSITSSRSG